jgi:hypothetical protein
MTIEEIFKQAAIGVRDQLADMDSLYSFNLRLEADGHVHQGDLNITIRLGSNSYSTGVEVNRLEPVVTEYMRRNGWDDANAPLCLSYNETICDTVSTNDE